MQSRARGIRSQSISAVCGEQKRKKTRLFWLWAEPFSIFWSKFKKRLSSKHTHTQRLSSVQAQLIFIWPLLHCSNEGCSQNIFVGESWPACVVISCHHKEPEVVLETFLSKMTETLKEVKLNKRVTAVDGKLLDESADESIVCLGSLVWLFSPAWDAVKLILPGCWLHLSFRGH